MTALVRPAAALNPSFSSGVCVLIPPQPYLLPLPPPPCRMVQTQEQYVFIYQALREELQELLLALGSGTGAP